MNFIDYLFRGQKKIIPFLFCIQLELLSATPVCEFEKWLQVSKVGMYSIL